MSNATELKTVAGEGTQQDIKGKIVEFMWSMKRDGASERTIKNYVQYLGLLQKNGAILSNPETIKDTLAQNERWSTATKSIMVAAYDKFVEINGLTWKPPKYRVEQKIPFLPTEGEIDMLISSSGKKLSTLLQLLKESGLRVGEALRLQWMNLDAERSIITVNDTEKHGTPRIVKISGKLLSMLNNLPKKEKLIFQNRSVNSYGQSLWVKRRSLATKLQNPRFLEIHFHTLRHWKATMEYHKTKDILHVMNVLGHKNIKNTLIYTQMVNFETDDYNSATAHNASEAEKLVQAGFEYVCTTPETIMLFRKRK